MKLANKISLSIFLVAMLCTAAACLGLYLLARRGMEQAIKAHLESVVQARTDHIVTYLAMLKISINQVSTRIVLEKFLKTPGAERDRPSGELEVIVTRLRRTQEANPSIYEFLLLDKTGKVIAASRDQSIGADKSTDAIFLGGREKIYLKDVYYSEEFKEPLLAVSAPFSDSQTGEFLGVLAARVKLDELNNICKLRSGLGETGEIIIVNKYRFMITPSRFLRDMVLKQKADTEGVRQAFLHKDNSVIAQVFSDYRGVPVLGAHGYIPEMQWAVIAKVDAKEAFAPLAVILKALIILLLVVPLLAWLTGVLVARAITRALTRLHRGTEIIGTGNLDHKVGTAAKDEVGQLARAFDQMTENLKTTTTSVEHLNQEITKRKHSEENLRKITMKSYAREEELLRSETKFRTLYDSTSDAVMLLDEKGFFDCNKATLAIFGCATRDEFCSKHPADVSPPEQPCGTNSRTLANERIATAMKNGTNHFEWMHKRIDTGQSFNADVLLNAMELDGKPVLQAVVRDITEHKRAEEALRGSEEQLKNVFDSVKTGIVVIDSSDLHILEINQTASEMIGLPRNEIVGKSCHRFICPAEEGKCPIKHLGQNVDNSERVLLAGDGRAIPVIKTVTPITLNGRKCFLESFVDITDRKQAEEALSQSKADLEKAYQQLQESFELESKLTVQSQAASAAKSQFVANVSHEIRTPLNGIIGICELMLGTKLSNEQMEYAQIINTSADALLNIINSTLDFSKIEAGKLELEQLDFNLRDIIEDISAVLAVNAAKKQLELIGCIEPDVPLDLNGDPGRLRQILFNLIGNAIKFTHEGEITVKVERVEEGCSVVQSSERPGSGMGTGQPEHRTQNTEHSPPVLLRFAVRDTGIGIPADKIELLFQAFSQTDASLARKFGGTGLGLAISKGLVEQMGGSIGMESQHGQGSTFWFVIPFSRHKPEATPSAEPRINFDGASILIVDDNTTNRFVLAKQLEAWGIAADTAETGREALAKLRAAARENRPYTAAILDQRMPEMNGITLGQTIKHDPELGATILFLMSSMLLSQETYSEHRDLFAAMILKPIRQSQLYYNLLTALKDKKLNADEEQWAQKLRKQALLTPAERKLHILVAEDNMTNQKVILGILKSLGHSGVAVADGQEAVKALEMSPYDLVLMDIQMPEMDGLEAAAIIRDPSSKVRDHNIPILALTAYTMPEDRDKCLAAGMNDHITKPVSTQSIANAIANIVFPGNGQAPEDKLKPSGEGKTPPHSPSDEPAAVFDHQTFANRLSGDSSLIRAVINMFLEETPKSMRELEKTIKKQHKDQAARLAHTIKGSAANVGANQLQAIALKIETACQADDWRKAESFGVKLNKQFEMLERAMREFLKTLN